MDKKSNNPVEGRLSVPPSTKTEPHTKFARRKTNYGVERLGITSDTEQQSDKPVSDLFEKHKPPPPHTVAAQPITVLPVSKKITEQAKSVETTETKHQGHIPGKLSKYKKILGRKKIKTILLLAGIPVIALTLILWACLGDEETTPQVASAIEQSPPDRPAAMLATKNASKPPQNSLEIAKRPTKHKPVKPGESATHRPKIRPTSPTVKETRQQPKSEQTVPAKTPVFSAFRDAFKFLAEMKPDPKTTAPAPAKTAHTPKPKQVVRKAAVVTLAPSHLGLRLGGIMRRPDGKIALINNRSVKVGQTVNRAKIVHIGDFSVEVEVKGKRYLVGIASPVSERTSDRDEDEDESSDSDDDEKESNTEDE